MTRCEVPHCGGQMLTIPNDQLHLDTRPTIQICSLCGRGEPTAGTGPQPGEPPAPKPLLGLCLNGHDYETHGSYVRDKFGHLKRHCSACPNGNRGNGWKHFVPDARPRKVAAL